MTCTRKCHEFVSLETVKARRKPNRRGAQGAKRKLVDGKSGRTARGCRNSAGATYRRLNKTFKSAKGVASSAGKTVPRGVDAVNPAGVELPRHASPPEIIEISDDDSVVILDDANEPQIQAEVPPSTREPAPIGQQVIVISDDEEGQAEHPPIIAHHPRYTRENEIRDLLQARLVMRQSINLLGEERVLNMMSNLESTAPNMLQICKEELIIFWRQKGELSKIPASESGLYKVSVPTVDHRIVRSEVDEGPLWVPAIPQADAEIGYIDLTVGQE